jgi:hypothetical protein
MKLDPLSEWGKDRRQSPLSHERIAETHARESTEIQIRRVNLGIEPNGDGGDLRVGGQVSGGFRGFQHQAAALG